MYKYTLKTKYMSRKYSFKGRSSHLRKIDFRKIVYKRRQIIMRLFFLIKLVSVPFMHRTISVRFKFECHYFFSVEKTCFFNLISERFWINACFDFGSPQRNNQNKICIFFFWLNGFLIILIEWFWEKKSGGRSLVAPRFFG